MTTLVSPLSSSFRKLLVLTIVVCTSAFCFAQQPESSTETTNVVDATGATVPYRIVNKQTKENGRTTERQVYEAPSINGGYAPTSDVEQETIKVNDSTTKVIMRSYVQDANGSRRLSQITEQERVISPDGHDKVVSTTSRVDDNDRWQVVQRETQDSVPTGKDSRRTTSTVMRQSANGLVPVLQTETTEQREGNTTRTRQVVSNADANGGFLPSRVKETSSTETNDGITTDEKLFADDGRGQMALVDRSITVENKNGEGKSQQNVEQFSEYVPGAAPDGSLHLVRRSSQTAARDSSGAMQTHSQDQSVNPGNPADGLQTVTTATTVTTPTGPGKSDTKTTVRSLNGNGSFGTVFVTDSHETKVLPTPQSSQQPSAEPK